jgi:hypothetical protein
VVGVWWWCDLQADHIRWIRASFFCHPVRQISSKGACTSNGGRERGGSAEGSKRWRGGDSAGAAGGSYPLRVGCLLPSSAVTGAEMDAFNVF